MRIYTIGHSNHTWACFANKRTLPALCEAAGLRYAFIGDSLGGKPGDPFACDASGNPDYAKIAARPIFGNFLIN